MKTFIKLYTEELKNKGLSLYDKAVFGSLVTKYQYHNNSEFYTYEKFIADELEISESSVKRSIKKLNEVGLISINKKFHKQLKQTVNYYSINLEIEKENLPTEPEQKQNLELSTAITQSQPEETKVELHVFEHDNNTDVVETIEYDNKDTYYNINQYIEKKYNMDAVTYMNQFTDTYALGYSRLEEIADAANITPDDVLSFYKDIKKAV